MKSRRKRDGCRSALSIRRVRRRLPVLVLDEPIVLGTHETRLIVRTKRELGPTA